MMDTDEANSITYIGLLCRLASDARRFMPRTHHHKRKLSELDDWMVSYIDNDKKHAKKHDLKLLLNVSRFMCDKQVKEDVCYKVVDKVVKYMFKMEKYLCEAYENSHVDLTIRPDLLLKQWRQGEVCDYYMLKYTMIWRNEVSEFLGNPHYYLLADCATACIMKEIETRFNEGKCE